MALLRPTIWTQQPQQPVEIDWSNPITRGLVRFANAALGASGKFYDSANPSVYYTSASPSPGVNSAGRVITKDSTTLYLGSSNVGHSSIGTGDATFIHVGTSRSNNTSQYLLTITTGSSATGDVSVGYRTGFVTAINVFNGALAVSPVGAQVPGRTETSVIVRKSGVAYFWLNGVYLGSAANASAFSSTAPFSIGAASGNQKEVNCGGLFTRALSDLEVLSISANPWQIFKPIPRQLFVAASGGSGVTGTANITETAETVSSSGTVLVGGTSSTTNSAQTVSSSGAVAISGSASVTESAETLTASGSVVAVVTGTASITESAETLSSSGTVAISGSASVTETAETLSASGTVVSGVVGTASITETAETVTASGSIAIGGTASISPNAQTVVSSGTIAITGTVNVYELAETLTASGIALGGVTGSADLTQAAQTMSAFATSAFPTIGRPDADVSNAGWTPFSGSDLYAMLDEVTPDDADYISASSVGAVCSIGLNATQYPGPASQQLSLRASSSTGNGLTVVIKDGATTIATRSLTLTPTYELHTITLTSGEIAAITTGNLTVEMTST